MTFTRAQLAAIKALENRQGQIQPRQIVQAAKQRRSPLHALFDWNVTAAAEKWWLHRAREIIGAVTIQVTTQEFTYKAPAYIVDTTVEGQGYRSTAALKDDRTSARESLIYTLDIAAGHIRRALDIAAPLGLSREVDQLLQKIAAVQRVTTEKAA